MINRQKWLLALLISISVAIAGPVWATTPKEDNAAAVEYSFDYKECTGAKRSLYKFLRSSDFDKAGENAYKIITHAGEYQSKMNAACQKQVVAYECPKVRSACMPNVKDRCCITKPIPVSCPADALKACPEGSNLTKVQDERGCWKPVCEKQDSCPVYNKPVCSKGETLTKVQDKNGCWKPVCEKQDACPVYNKPVCSKGETLTKVQDKNGCWKPVCEKQNACPDYTKPICNKGGTLTKAQDKNGCWKPICENRNWLPNE